jgi:hypothetical protein
MSLIWGMVMEIARHSSVPSHLAVRNYGGLIKLAYVAVAIVAIALLYLAIAGPGVNEAELALATVGP